MSVLSAVNAPLQVSKCFTSVMSCALTPVLLPLALSSSETCYLAERISAWKSLTSRTALTYLTQQGRETDKEEFIKMLQAKVETGVSCLGLGFVYF